MKAEFNDNQGLELALCLLEWHKNPGPCKLSPIQSSLQTSPESKEPCTTLRIMAPAKIRRIQAKSVAQCSQGFWGGGYSFVLGRYIRVQNIIIFLFIHLKLESLRQGAQISYYFTHTQTHPQP